MPVSIGQSPAHDFNEPLAMLSDCHRRIERFLGVLTTLAALPGETLTAEQQAALSAALWYFRESGPRHTADEEESLFPRLRALPAAAEALREIDSLQDDHRRAEQLHQEVHHLAIHWMKDGRLPAEERARLEDAVSALADIYRPHIAREDATLFPLAGQVLAAADIEAIGREMAARRGLSANLPERRS